MDFASSFVYSDNLLEAIGFGTLGTNWIGKTCESSARWEHRGWSGPDNNIPPESLQPIPSENPRTYLSHTVGGPMIISITVLIMLSCLRRSQKPISNTS